ncbi:hypothetical protein T11_7636 [Trichinella zimbabwensis]|uniref:Uncharacterized protein n=1 Tax=Trichinella zimbabwensis TaxID=268475 RepID=A0A0V1GJI3_9BILA|nr:hypothetical protein T11_7636 [Trichinella zimbabwensis]
MDPVEWLETMEEFLYVTGVPSSHQTASVRLSVGGAARRELFPLGAARDISWDELKRRVLDTYGHGESLIQLAVRFNGLKQRKNQEMNRELRLRESATLVKARQLAENATKLQTEVVEARHRTNDSDDTRKDSLVQAMEAQRMQEFNVHQLRCGRNTD